MLTALKIITIIAAFLVFMIFMAVTAIMSKREDKKGIGICIFILVSQILQIVGLLFL